MKTTRFRFGWQFGLVAGAALFGGLTWPTPALAVNVTVTSNADSGAGSLREAINTVNSAGAGTHTITISVGSPIVLSSGLPMISNSVTIDGSGSTIDGNNASRIFFVGSGDVEIRDVTLTQGHGLGGSASPGAPQNEGGGGGGGLGAGGAIFVNSGANVTVRSVTFSDNSAQGGNGGSSVGGGGLYDAGGGGGGFTGNGGRGGFEGGGGGGGLAGNGGSAPNTTNNFAGAGGGGATANGSNAVANTPGAGGGGEGGAGGSSGNNGTSGAAFGGGGGGGANANGAAGGDFGGGGGGGYGSAGTGGQGGFGAGGGGGGGGSSNTGGTGGFGGGNGGGRLQGGEGGDGLGGAIFVRTGGTLTVIDSAITGSSVTGGTAGTGGSAANGQTAGAGMYVMTGVNATVNVTGTLSYSDTIAGTGTLIKTGAGTLTLAGANANTFSGTTKVNQGILRLNKTPSVSDLGVALKGDVEVASGATLMNLADSQIADTSTITINGGTYSLGAHSETIKHLILNGGQVTGTSGGGGLAFDTSLGIKTIGSLPATISSRIALASAAPTDTNSRVFDIGSNAPLTVSGEIYNGGSGPIGITKTGGGALILSGANTYTGDTLVDNGYLAINGSVAGNVLVDFNGVLGGNGTIGGDLFYDGAVTPGASPVSIGTLTVLGNFTPGANSYLHINFDETHHSEIHAHSATLGGNGTVYFHSLNGQYVPNTQYTFLTTTTSISGQFNNVLDDLPLVDVLVGYTSNSAYFYILPNGTSFSSVANTPNQQGVANYLDANSTGATGDFSTIIDHLTVLNTAQLRSAFDQLSGEAHATSSQVGVQTTTLMLQQIAQRLRSMSAEEGTTTNYMATTTPGSSGASSPIQLVGGNGSSGSTVQNPVMICDACDNCCNWNGWSVGYGLGGKTDRDNNAAGFSYGMGGVLVGADRWIDDQQLVGITGGYVGSSFTTAGPDARVRNSAGQVATYFLRTNCDFYLSGVGGFQFDSYTSQRDINAGGLNRTASANYDGWQGYTYGELGRNLTGQCGMLQPFVALQYVHLRQNGFDETGAGAANLNVSGIDTDSLRSFVGTRVLGNFGRRLTPEFQASWVHEYDSASSVLNARFGAIGGAGFATQGVNAGRDWALLGTGLNYCLSENIQLTGNYYAQVNSHQTYHVGAGGLLFLW